MVDFYSKVFNTGVVSIISKFILIISSIIFARTLGPDDFGVYSWIISIITLATLPVVAGIPNLLIREIANYKMKKNIAELVGILRWSQWYVLGMSLSIFIIMQIIISYDLFDYSDGYILFIASFIIPLKGIITRISSIINGLQLPALSQVPLLIIYPFLSIFLYVIYFLLTDDADFNILIIINVISYFVTWIISEFILNKKINLSKFEHYKIKYELKKWNSSLVPFFLMALVVTLNIEIASVFLGWMSLSSEVAFFKVASQSVNLLNIGLVTINAVIMPNIAVHYKSGNILKVQEVLTKSVRLGGAISVPAMLLFLVFGDNILIFLFGSEYVSAYPILIVLCIGQLFNVLMGSAGVVMNMTGYEHNTLKTLVVSFGINLILMLICIPLYNALGAAIAMAISTILLNVYLAYSVHNKTTLKTYLH